MAPEDTEKLKSAYADDASATPPAVAAEAPAGLAEPSQANGPGDGSSTCGRCSAVNPPGAETCAQCHCFLPANQVARQTGIYAQRQPADLRERVDTFTAGVLSDLGGASELSTLERAYVGRLAEVEIVLRLLAHDIAERGLLTPSGGVRRVHDAFLSAVDRWDRLAQRLGVARRARRVASTFDAAIAAEPEAR